MPNIEKNDTCIGPLYQFLADPHCITESSDDRWAPAAQVRAGPHPSVTGGCFCSRGSRQRRQEAKGLQRKSGSIWFCLEIPVNLGHVNKYLWGGGGDGLLAKSCLTLATPWTAAHQAPLFIGFSRQEYWSGLPFPSPGQYLQYEVLCAYMYTTDELTHILISYLLFCDAFTHSMMLSNPLCRRSS